MIFGALGEYRDVLKPKNGSVSELMVGLDYFVVHGCGDFSRWISQDGISIIIDELNKLHKYKELLNLRLVALDGEKVRTPNQDCAR